MDDRSVAQIAPSGIFLATPRRINCDNPLLSAQQRAIVCSPANLVNADGVPGPDVFIDQNGNPYNHGVLYAARRNVEGGGRRDDLQHTDYRIVAGVRGDLGRGFGPTTSPTSMAGSSSPRPTSTTSRSPASAARSTSSTVRRRASIRSAARRSTAPMRTACPTTSSRSAASRPAALAYLQTPGFSRGNTQESVVTGSTHRQARRVRRPEPVADDRRRHRHRRRVSQGEARLQHRHRPSRPATSPARAAPTIGVTGDFDVMELFGEIQIPLIHDPPFFEELEFGAGYRYSDYDVANNSFSTDTYKFGRLGSGSRHPLPRQLQPRRPRAEHRRAVLGAVGRARGQHRSVRRRLEPVGGLRQRLHRRRSAPTPASRRRQYGNITPNPADQYNGLLGGNPDLEPETADTYTVGVVLQPRFLPRFALTVDWFDIRIEDTIGTIGADMIINQCLADRRSVLLLAGQPRAGQRKPLADAERLHHRHQRQRRRAQTRGIDVNASYTQPLGGLGSLAFSFVGTWLDKLVVNSARRDPATTAPASSGRRAARPIRNGGTSSASPTPLRTASASRRSGGTSRRSTTTCSSDDIDLCPNATTTGCANQAGVGGQRIESQSYLDLVLTARIGDHYSFRLGANNILDRIRRPRSRRLRSATATPIRRCTTRSVATSSRA